MTRKEISTLQIGSLLLKDDEIFEFKGWDYAHRTAYLRCNGRIFFKSEKTLEPFEIINPKDHEELFI